LREFGGGSALPEKKKENLPAGERKGGGDLPLSGENGGAEKGQGREKCDGLVFQDKREKEKTTKTAKEGRSEN